MTMTANRIDASPIVDELFKKSSKPGLRNLDQHLKQILLQIYANEQVLDTEYDPTIGFLEDLRSELGTRLALE